MKISAVLVISLISAVGGSLFLSGFLPFLTPSSHSHQVPEAEATTLPLHIIERFEELRLAGDAETGSNMQVDEDFVDPENHCEFCTRVEYVPGSRGIAGFAYSSEDALDLTGAKKVRFWVMGEDGGEKVKFKLAGKKSDIGERRNANSLAVFDSEIFSRTSTEVSLKKAWTKYEVDLEGADLRDITHPFGFELEKGSGDRSQVVYIKGVIIDDEPVESENALETVSEEITEDSMIVEIISRETDGDTSTSFRFRSDVTGGERPFEYLWEFGDGTERSGRNVAHTFDEPGTYNVTLVVTDDSGQEASDSIEIEIEQPEDEQSANETEEERRSDSESGSEEPPSNATDAGDQEQSPGENVTETDE